MVLLLHSDNVNWMWSVLVLLTMTPRPLQANPSTPAPLVRNCRCVPDQWEGILISVERDFDMNEGRMDEMESRVMVHYDYTNQRFAMTEFDNGKTVVEDYARRMKYIIMERGCYFLPTDDTMKRMCLPEESRHLGVYQLAADVPISLYQLSSGTSNMSLSTAVRERSCLPVYEDVLMSARGFASVTNSYYLNTHPRIRDHDVFRTPANCVPAEDLEYEHNDVTDVRLGKRGPSSFSSSILDRFRA